MEIASWQDGIDHNQHMMQPKWLCYQLYQQTACLLKGHLIQTNYGKCGSAIMPPEHPDWQRWLDWLEALAACYGCCLWEQLSLTGEKYVARLSVQTSSQKTNLRLSWQQAVDHRDMAAIFLLGEQLFGKSDLSIQWLDLAVEMAELYAAVESGQHDGHNGVGDEIGDVFFSWIRLYHHAIVHHGKHAGCRL
jgi:hypothetical protein